MTKLKLSNDRKVSPRSVWRNAARRWEPEIPNAFGLPAIDSCPGSTPSCRAVCYADAIHYPSARALLQHNYHLLRKATPSRQYSLLSEMLSEYRTAHDKAEAKYNTTFDRVFRIHWSGDFFNAQYTNSWRRIINDNPDIQFWTYTRSAFVPSRLAGLPNLALYLSVDHDNSREMLAIAAEFDLPTAGMGTDVPLSDHLFSTINCPETSKRIPLVSDSGEGACVACGACIRGNRSVSFDLH